MPPRWPRQPTRQDPSFRKLDDRMNFAVHVAAFIAVNSGLWFFHTLNPEWVAWAKWVTLPWLIGLFGHGVYIFVFSNYSPVPLSPNPDTANEGDT